MEYPSVCARLVATGPTDHHCALKYLALLLHLLVQQIWDYTHYHPLPTQPYSQWTEQQDCHNLMISAV